MARLEYDESGSTFYYFLLSFYGIVLLPITYFLWPRREDEEEAKGLVCQCEPCRRKKAKLDVDQPKKRYMRIARIVALVVLWSFFAVMLFKVVTLERDYVEYDPFEILELETDASVSEIRRQYRRLSKVYHPDKEGGDQEMFMRIAKAYEALTDEESKRNWKEYGNPDGPKAAVFGIALPSWIVEKSNSIWILGLYVAVFIIGLPVIVGVWWYKSSQYGHTNVFLNTSRLFWMLLARTKTTTVKQVVMILTAAQEFSPHQSKVMKERPSDDAELSELIRTKMLPHVDIRNKKVPFSIPYAAKARILVHAHLERVELPESTLQIDQGIILKACPQLLNEMMNIVTGIWVNAQQQPRKGFPIPSLDVFESVMQVSQIIIQGMWGRASPLLQLPHLHPTLLKHFRTRRRNINTLEQFVAMKEKERRALVRTLSDEEYLDIMAVCSMFPHVDIHAETKVVGDEDHHRITSGSVVTLIVRLKRQGLLDYHSVSVDGILGSSVDQKSSGPPLEDGHASMEFAAQGEEPETIGNTESPPKKAVWSRPQKKKKKGKHVPPTVRRRKPVPGGKGGRKDEERAKTQVEGDGIIEREEEEGEGSDSEVENVKQIETNRNEESDRDSVHDEDEEWRSLQEGVKDKRWYEGANRESFPVHAPHFPEVKQECWWLYVVEKRVKKIIVPPRRVVGLRDEQSVDLRFIAPPTQGSVRYTVILVSDSYLDLSFQKELKLQVHEREEVHNVAQWRDLEEEEEEEEMIEESESESEGDNSEGESDDED